MPQCMLRGYVLFESIHVYVAIALTILVLRYVHSTVRHMGLDKPQVVDESLITKSLYVEFRYNCRVRIYYHDASCYINQ